MTGVRIRPGTDLARSALRDGYVASGRDLAEPVFYFSPARRCTRPISWISS